MKIKSILFSLIAFMAFSACNDDTDPKLYVEGVIKLEALEKEALVFTKETVKQDVMTFNWSAVDINMKQDQKYAIQIDTIGGDFKNAPFFGDTDELTVTVKGKAINDIIVKKLGQEPETSRDYQLRAITVVKNKDGKLIALNQGASEPQKINLTATQTTPEDMYMIGSADFLGIWDWNKCVSLTRVNGTEGVFWTVKYLIPDDKFKFNTSKAWDGSDFAGLSKNDGFEIKDGNASIKEAGLYMVYINYLEEAVTIEPAQIFGIGDVWGAWDEGMESALFTLDKTTKKVSATLPNEKAANLRIYAKSKVATTAWWTREFVVRRSSEKIEYRGNGGDLPAEEVKKGETVTIDFNANTGTIK